MALNIPKFGKREGNGIYCIEEDIPVLVIRLFPNKHEIDAEGEWNSPVYILMFSLKPCLEDRSVGSNTINYFLRSYLAMFLSLSLLVKTI